MLLAWPLWRGVIVMLYCCCHRYSLADDSTDAAVLSRFPESTSATHLTNALVDVEGSGNVYVGSVNWLYVLDDSLQLKKAVHVGPKNDNVECSPDPDDECSEPRRPTNSTVLALAIDKGNNVLIACSDRYYGYCFKVSLASFAVTDEVFMPIGANREPPVLLVGPGFRSEGVLYVGTTHGVGLPLYKDRVPMLAVRELEGFNIAHVDTSTASNIDLLPEYRESFDVHFVHAFTYGQYTYFLVVRRDKPGAGGEAYGTKVIRLCHKDERFQSYVEMSLDCGGGGSDPDGGGGGYNILMDAYVSKPGKDLGKTLGFSPTDDVIFGTFARSADGSMTGGADSAVCLFSMAEIAEKIIASIKFCFSGLADIGPAHLTTPVPCTRFSFPIEADYCMEADHNYPIETKLGTSSRARYIVPRQLTSVAIKVTSDSLHTLAVLGTADGKVLQASIDDQTTMAIFAETDLGSGAPVHRDMYLDKAQEHVYVMSQQQMSRVSIKPDCESLKTCGECLGGGNPHCGWCTMENGCMPRRDCSEADNKYWWLAYNHELGCPAITSQDPRIVPYDYADSTMILLSLNFLPEDLQMRPLKCAVRGYGETFKSNANINLENNKIICDPFKLLPSIPDGEAHLDMQLSVLVYSTCWISSNITFWDCGHLDSCGACASTDLPCYWCLEGNSCLPETSTCLSESYSSMRLRRQAPPTAVALSPALTSTPAPTALATQLGTRVRDATLCPRVRADKTQFLTPVGFTAKLSLYATELRDFQLRELKCNFDIGSGRVVDAKHTYDTIKERYQVDCQPISFNYEESKPYVDVPFDISWDVGKLLDNPNKIHVRAFKCSAMVSSCGLCALLDPVFHCGWCGNQCLQREECGADGSNALWLQRNVTCPNAQIIDFSPKSGSMNGGTNITVTGINLGKTLADLTSVTVAGIPCKVIHHAYNASLSFTCTAGPCSRNQAGNIEVLIAGSVAAKSVGKFTYVDPVLGDFVPQRGPLSGGTHVVISGDNLDLGSKIVVSINARDCPVVRRNFTHLEFVTSGQEKPLDGKVKVTVDGSEETILGSRFIYVVDPTVSSVSPTSTLLSGGTNVTVKGRNLDSIRAPKLLIKINDLTDIKTGCVGVNSTTLTCTLPPLLDYGVSATSTRPAEMHYGLLMDAVLPLRNVSKRGPPSFGPMRVYPDPALAPLQMTVKYADDLTLYIEGEQLLVFESVAGLSVLVGDQTCETIDVSDVLISCTPPPSIRPDFLDKQGNAQIKVQHGLYVSLVGHMNYAGGGAGGGKEVIIFAVLGSVVLICLIVVVVFLVRRERRRRKKKTMPPPPTEIRRRYSDVERYKGTPGPGGDGRGGRDGGATATAAAAAEEEMVPLKGSELDMPFDDDGMDPAGCAKVDGKPFRVEDLLDRVKSNRLKNSIKEVLIPRERLDLGEIIGRGHFGCVYAAYLRDENQENAEKVAVKTLQAYSLGESFNQQSVELFLKEGVTMRNFNHLHVLKLLGVCFDEEAQPMVILPYMAKGDLRSYVKDKKKNFTARQLLQLGRQVAEGMSYLASLNFVHRDLAARNCMIDENDQVKVADFGLSRELYEKDYYSSKDLDRKGKMPIKWMALESLEDFVFTTKSDVWSFGVLMWELMMRGVTPYPDVDVFDVRNFLASGRRLRKPKYCPDNIYQIMLDCWNAQPILRPSFTDLVNRIELMLNPTARSPKPPMEADEPEQIYMNLASTDNQDYLHPVDNTDGSVSFKPAAEPHP